MSQRHERIKRPPRREAFSYTFHIHVVQTGIAADLEEEGVFLHAHLQQVETHAVLVPAVEDVAYQQADDEGLVGAALQVSNEILLSLAFGQPNLGLSYFVGVLIHGFTLSIGFEVQRVIIVLANRATGGFYYFFHNQQIK